VGEGGEWAGVEACGVGAKEAGGINDGGSAG
jgi:hypothetical protein